MKKFIMILFLLTGLTDFLHANDKHYKNKSLETINKKEESKKPVSHFEKLKKDKRITSNGTRYKKHQRYKMVRGSFKPIPVLRKDNKFVSHGLVKRKQYNKQLAGTIYSRKHEGKSLRRAFRKMR